MSESNPWDVLAECSDCKWNFQRHEYETIKESETEGMWRVVGRLMMLHSKASGHSVRVTDD